MDGLLDVSEDLHHVDEQHSSALIHPNCLKTVQTVDNHRVHDTTLLFHEFW